MTRLLLMTALLLAVAASARGHEIGTTQATALIRPDGTYQVDVTIDPDALLTKLEVYRGEPLSSNLSRVERDARIESLSSVFLEQVRVRFDEVASRPAF